MEIQSIVKNDALFDCLKHQMMNLLSGSMIQAQNGVLNDSMDCTFANILTCLVGAPSLMSQFH